MTAAIPLYQYVIFVRLLNSAQFPRRLSESCLNVQRGLWDLVPMGGDAVYEQ